jgi:hypothetical protein
MGNLIDLRFIPARLRETEHAHTIGMYSIGTGQGDRFDRARSLLAVLLAKMLARIDRLTADIEDLTAVIEQLLAPYEEQLQQAESMPGWARRAA